MDLKQLRALLVVAETGNVTRAAQVLHIVQPAVSRQLRLLEEDVGARLFERERHGMVLTEAGRVLVEHARRALLELERARAGIAGGEQEPGGVVTLGLLPSTVEEVAPALVAEVARRYPAVRLRLEVGFSGILSGWLRAGDVDAAVLYGAAERSPEIDSEPLVDEALWVVAPPAAELRASRPVPLASLAGRPMILPSAPHGIRALVTHACAVSGVELQVAIETNALEVQRSLVLAGHGWTILPPIALAADLRAGLLSAAPIVEPNITRHLVLALPANRVVSRVVHNVAQLLAHCAKSAVTRSAIVKKAAKAAAKRDAASVSPTGG